MEQILYSDELLLVVNKPPGLATVPGGWEEDTSNLLELLEAEYGSADGPEKAIWIVHRLDRVTSGVVLFARTAEAHRALSLLFESRAVHKVYHALVTGLPSWEQQTARQPLRADVGHSHRTAVDWKNGKPAVTHFRVSERFKDCALLEAIPETGRTHQVRAHAAALGFPLLADTLYSALPTGLISRPALHAYSLEFEFQGKLFSFTAPYPDDLKAALRLLRRGHEHL